MNPYQTVLTELFHEFPDFHLRLKSESIWMHAIELFIRCITFGQNRTFMTSYTTTLGSTVFVPSDWTRFSPESRAMILRHERAHLRQQRRFGRALFALLYLFPVFPLFLAWGRARLELEAYTESLRAAREYRGDLFMLEYQEALVRQFTTGAYGWMWPFPRTVARWIQNAATKISMEGRMLHGPESH